MEDYGQIRVSLYACMSINSSYQEIFSSGGLCLISYSSPDAIKRKITVRMWCDASRDQKLNGCTPRDASLTQSKLVICKMQMSIDRKGLVSQRQVSLFQQLDQSAKSYTSGPIRQVLLGASAIASSTPARQDLVFLSKLLRER